MLGNKHPIYDFKENSVWSENLVASRSSEFCWRWGKVKAYGIIRIWPDRFRIRDIIVSCSRSFRMRWFGPSSSRDVRLLLTGYNVTFAAGTYTGASLSLDVVTAISADKLCVYSWVHNRLSHLRFIPDKMNVQRTVDYLGKWWGGDARIIDENG